MNHTSIVYLDRLRSKNVFRGTTATYLGAIATLVLIAGTAAFFIPTIIAFFQGYLYFQSEFQTQQSPYGNLTVGKDTKLAIVFQNKTSLRTANHTLLRQYMFILSFRNSQFAATMNSDVTTDCDLSYFSTALNPPDNFTDCFIFAKNSKIDISYTLTNGLVSFGLYAYPYCSDPFKCLLNSTTRNAVFNNFSNIFNNYTYTLYFTTKVMQPNGTFVEQVFALYQSSFNAPLTISSDGYAEIEIKNTTMDDSILPWKNFKSMMAPAWYGSTSSSPKNTTVTQTGVRAGLKVSKYQNQAYRYYKKADWLLGIIGGAMFLFYMFLYFPSHFFNSCQKRRSAAAQLLLWHNNMEVRNQLNSFYALFGDVLLTAVEPSKLYFLKKLWPLYQSPEATELNHALDIATLIKKLQVAQRNLLKQGKPLYNKNRGLKIGKDQPNEVERNNQNLAIGVNQVLLTLKNPAEPLNINEQRPEQIEVQPSLVPKMSSEPINPDQQPPLGGNPSDKGQAQQQPPQAQGAIQLNDGQAQKQAMILGMHQQVLRAVKESTNSAELVGVDPTLLAINNKRQEYQLAFKLLRYKKDNPSRHKNCFSRIATGFFDFIRFFDIFGVQPQFDLHSAGSSIFGCLAGLFMIGSAILFFIFIILNAQSYQTFVEYSYQEASKVNYTVVTGAGFRPFVCLPSPLARDEISQASPVIQLSFFSDTPSGRVTIPAVNMEKNQYAYLGISPDSYYYNPSVLNTSLCYVMEQNHTIPMAGFNTTEQSYFGFRIDPYCSGTPAFCRSINATLKQNVVSFLKSYSMTLYLPFNTYNPDNRTLGGGGVIPQTLREGSQSLSINGGILQTFYVDQIQLIDDYTMRFLGMQNPPILQQSITANRYLQASNVQGINATMPFLEARIRPSGKVSKVVLTGTPTDVLLGVIGGITVIFYALLHCFAKGYNHYCARAYLASEIYEQLAYDSSFLHKLLVMVPIPLCKCLPDEFRNQIMRHRQVDKVIKYELNQLQMVKQLTAIYHLSTAGFQTPLQKHLGLIYYKKLVPENYLAEISAQQLQPFGNNNDGNAFMNIDENQSLHSQQQMHSQHAVANQNEQQPRLAANTTQNQQVGQDSQPQPEVQIDYFEPYDSYRSPYAAKESACLHFFDWFNTKPSFTLNGQRKVKSVFGSLLFFAVVACIVILVQYQIKAYRNDTNSRISLNKYLVGEAKNEAALVLNSSNFRLSLGFYLNPNGTYTNVSSILNTTSNVTIYVSQVTLTRANDSTLTQNETLYSLEPCTTDYFTNFTDSNTDYSFLNGLENGWCLPTNVSFNLSPISTRDLMQYVTIRITNKTRDATALSNLLRLTSTYVAGVYMTVPQLDFAGKRFVNTVRQIRGYPNPTTRATEFNLTLTKQQIYYASPNYTLSPPLNSLSSYTYLNNKDNERKFFSPNTSLTRTYNFTLCYLGLIEEFTYSQPNANEIVGVIGGLIVLFYAVGIVIGESFNTYKYKYLLAKQLFLINPAQRTRIQQTEKQQVRKDLSYEVQYNQLQLFGCWILSFFFCVFGCFRALKMMTIMQAKAEQALNLTTFYVKKAQLKDTLNNLYKLSANPAIKVTNLIAKLPLIGVSQQFQLQQCNKDYVKKHGLSSYDQQILSQARAQRSSFSQVYKTEQIYSYLFLQRQEEGQSAMMPINPSRQVSTKVQMKQPQEQDHQPQRLMQKSQKSVRKPHKSVGKSEKSVEKSQKQVQKSQKPMKAERQPISPKPDQPSFANLKESEGEAKGFVMLDDKVEQVEQVKAKQFKKSVSKKESIKDDLDMIEIKSQSK